MAAQVEDNSKANVKTAALPNHAFGATVLIAIQVGSRAVTFLINQLLLRYMTPNLFGVATQLEIYSISVLVFSRDSLRLALQRQTDQVTNAPARGEREKNSDRSSQSPVTTGVQAVVNLSYVSIILGVLFATGLAWIYLRTIGASDPAILQVPLFLESLQLYALAAFLELLSEPCFAVVQHKSRFKVRAAAESVGAICRCFLTCGTTILGARRDWEIGVLPFALGQLGYAISLLVVYYYSVRQMSSVDGFSLKLSPIPSSDIAYLWSYFSWPLLSLGTSLFVQSWVKYALTQGDSIIIAYLTSQETQGAYALANNYGGLIARLGFQPIEESSRNYFGKILSSVERDPTKADVNTARQNLHILLRCYTIFSVFVMAVGPAAAPPILSIVAGQRWINSGAGNVLATYCFYIPVLAINGVTEAFVSSVATKAEIYRQSSWMLAFSIGFASAAYILLHILDLGAEGLVWANTLNMSFRIVWSLRFIDGYLKRYGTVLKIGSFLPSRIVMAACVGVHAILARLDSTFNNPFIEVFKCAVMGLLLLSIIVITEHGWLLESYRLVKT